MTAPLGPDVGQVVARPYDVIIIQAGDNSGRAVQVFSPGVPVFGIYGLMVPPGSQMSLVIGKPPNKYLPIRQGERYLFPKYGWTEGIFAKFHGASGNFGDTVTLVVALSPDFNFDTFLTSEWDGAAPWWSPTRVVVSAGARPGAAVANDSPAGNASNLGIFRDWRVYVESLVIESTVAGVVTVGFTNAFSTVDWITPTLVRPRTIGATMAGFATETVIRSRVAGALGVEMWNLNIAANTPLTLSDLDLTILPTSLLGVLGIVGGTLRLSATGKARLINLEQQGHGDQT